MTEPAYNFDPTTIVHTMQKATSGQIAHISVDYSNIVIVINTHEETRCRLPADSLLQKQSVGNKL